MLNARNLLDLENILKMSAEQRREFAANRAADVGEPRTEGFLWLLAEQLALAVCDIRVRNYAGSIDEMLAYVEQFESYYGKEHLLQIVRAAVVFAAARDALFAVRDLRSLTTPDWAIKPALLFKDRADGCGLTNERP